MERLTARTENGKAIYSGNVIEKSLNYEQTILDRLAELEDKIESGKLVEIPCKVGDTVYWAWILEKEKAEVFEGKVRGLSISQNGTTWFSVVYDNGLTFEHTFKDDWGKTVFLTRKQAEAKLEELQQNN